MIQPPLIDASLRKQRSDWARERLVSARAAVEVGAEAGRTGDALCRELADAADQVLQTLFAQATSEIPRLPAQLAVIATGGYGRRELLPRSDLDLVFLVPRRSTDPMVGKLAEAVLYPLWDARLDVGHAVRTPEEMVTLGKDDLAVATELLDTRLVCGPPALHTELVELARRALDRDPNGFIKRLEEERKSRHERFGDTMFLLEPNLKNGPGGHRDLLLGLWAARARWIWQDPGFGPGAFHALARLGALGERAADALEAARAYYLSVRFLCHLKAGRRQDQLTFQLQEALARQIYPHARVQPGEVRPAVAPAVEALMHTLQVHAKHVQRETERLLERSLVPARRKPVVRRLDGSFSTFNGRVTTNGADILVERPWEAVRIFEVALDLGAELHGHTRDLLADFATRVGAGLQTREASESFLSLLCDPRDLRNPSLLEQLHDLGLLSALIPEWGPCTGRVQHDLYHVYTVDQHSLYAVQYCKRLQRGELSAERPLATQAIREITRPRALYLGMLLHDVGKPLGRGHSEKGARIAAEACRRLGLDAEDAERVELLVRRHLVMSHLSQRRDVHDGAMIARFAADVGDEETLRELFVLTLADMTMTNPGAMTEWRASLLGELYERTLAYLRRGPDLASRDGSAHAKARRKKAAEACEGLDAATRAVLDALPDRYFSVSSPQAVRRHLEVFARRRADGTRGAIAVEHRPKRGFTELVICAEDHPGLLSHVAGVLLGNRIDVLAAQVTSFPSPDAAPGDPGIALDVFHVRDRVGRAITDEARWQKVASQLEAVLAGETDPGLLVEKAKPSAAMPVKHEPEVLTEIEIDNQVSADFTVIDVYTQDRPGVLYAVTRTLAELDLDIQLSKIATEANRVADVFYVRDREGGKIWDTARLAAIRGALERVLAVL